MPPNHGCGDQILTANQVAQIHRRNGGVTAGLLSDAVPTVAAVIEHLVWSANDRSTVGSCLAGDLWSSFRDGAWPRAGSADVSHPDWGLRILPPNEDIIVLRSVEAELRRKLQAHTFTSVMAKALAGATTEIINNVWEHAGSAARAILVYQLRDGVIDLGVADMGIGVLNSLKSNPSYRGLTTSMEALKKAMIVGVSRFPDEDRGLGFDTVLRAVADHWGAVRLRSGQAILEFSGSAHTRTAISGYGVPLPGLQVAFSCSATARSTKSLL